ncbi:MAG TPA: hypothetical protein VNF99_16955, partial [Stellaceae bacterium]|nr:hypothetical protein [Stellaceae bacterium]
DLESLGVARAAEHGRCPFIVLRAVADPASFALPPAASVGLDRDGRTAFGAVLRSVLRHPGQVPDLIRLGAHARRALAALGPAAAALRRADAARLSPPGGEG